jgi:hypothetical protein
VLLYTENYPCSYFPCSIHCDGGWAIITTTPACSVIPTRTVWAIIPSSHHIWKRKSGLTLIRVCTTFPIDCLSLHLLSVKECVYFYFKKYRSHPHVHLRLQTLMLGSNPGGWYSSNSLKTCNREVPSLYLGRATGYFQELVVFLSLTILLPAQSL